MMKPLYDSNHKIVGYVLVPQGRDKQVVFDEKHHIIGFYYSIYNAVTDKYGNFICYAKPNPSY